MYFLQSPEFSEFVRKLKHSKFKSYGGPVSKWRVYILYTAAEQKRWLSTTYFAPDPKLAKKKGHGTASKHQKCYSFMQICITRIIRVRGTVEAIMAQFQSAASQCPDSVQKRKLCLAFVKVVNDPRQRKKIVSGGWN